MKKLRWPAALVVAMTVAVLDVSCARKPQPVATTTQPADVALDPVIRRIREEGLERSKVMETASYLTDVIGPRLTGSPNLRRANDWTREKLTEWGLENAHLESWGPFGRGWSLERFSAQVVEPQAIPLIAFPKAWSSGLAEPLSAAPVVHVEGASESELRKHKGKLKGAVVLSGPTRDVAARFEAPAIRMTEQNLADLAKAGPETRSYVGRTRALGPSERRAALAESPLGRLTTTSRPAGSSTRPSSRPASPNAALDFFVREGAALIVTPSTQGDGGTLFVAQAAVPTPPSTRPTTRGSSRRPTTAPSTQPSTQPWAIDSPPVPPQLTMATEHYNRLVRMLKAGEAVKVAVEYKARYHASDLMAYNTIAEIPGSDLKDEIVMIGAHLDSWHSGTGATDNGAGCAAAMEAVRILKAAGIRPRRTIRIALWTGEEQGLLGSKAYVKKHFGHYPDGARPTTRPTTSASRPARPLVRGAGYEKLSAYFNLDNGTGRIRGVYVQANPAVRAAFQRYLGRAGFPEAQTLSLAQAGGTDHLSFDAIGLPGFQFIQDPVEYWSRTHHSNMDTFDRLQSDDLKQAATVMAIFLYEAATADERLPRKAGY